MKVVHDLILHFCKNQKLTREDLHHLNKNGFVKKGTYLSLLSYLSPPKSEAEVWPMYFDTLKTYELLQLRNRMRKDIMLTTGLDSSYLLVAPKPQAGSKNLDLGNYPLTPYHSSATISPQIKRNKTKAKAATK